MAAELRPRTRVTRVLAAGLCGLAMAELAALVIVTVTGGISFASAVGTYTVTNGAMGLAFGACGLLLAWHRPRHPIGWLFLAAGVAEATAAAAVQFILLGVRHGWPIGMLRLLGTLTVFSWPWAVGLCLPVALLLFPDGRPLGRRWRWVIGAAVAESVLFVLSFAGLPSTARSRSTAAWAHSGRWAAWASRPCTPAPSRRWWSGTGAAGTLSAGSCYGCCWRAWPRWPTGGRCGASSPPGRSWGCWCSR
jgi:hypothetical protein